MYALSYKAILAVGQVGYFDHCGNCSDTNAKIFRTPEQSSSPNSTQIKGIDFSKEEAEKW